MKLHAALLCFGALSLSACPGEPAGDDDDSFPTADDDDSTAAGDDDTTPAGDDDSTPTGDDDATPNCTQIRGTVDLGGGLTMPGAWGAVSVFLFKPEELSPEGYPTGAKPDSAYTVEGPALTAFPVNWEVCSEAEGEMKIMGVFDANNSGDICDAGDYHGLADLMITPGEMQEGVALVLGTLLVEGCRD